jgi:peptidoglycan/LPS O-acetylase OafA/YrhL
VLEIDEGRHAWDADKRRPRRLDSLTSLRFVAAAMVVCFHSAGRFGFRPDAERQPLQVALGSAVSLFFVLSGFVLAYNYAELHGRTAIRTYYRARVARIWPLHLACLAFIVLLDPAIRRPCADATLPWLPVHALLMQSWFPVNVAGVSLFNAVAWSLSVEWAFYLAFPLLLPVGVKRLEPRARSRAAELAIEFVAVIASCSTSRSRGNAAATAAGATATGTGRGSG